MCFHRILQAAKSGLPSCDLFAVRSPFWQLLPSGYVTCAAVGELLNLFMSDIPDDQLFQYADRVHDRVVIITGIGHLICMVGFSM